MEVLGIDIGGTGIKGAPVDTSSGELKAERFRLLTPKPSTPEKVVEVIHKIIRHFDWQGAVGAGFPGVVKAGKIFTAANVDKSWVGVHLQEMLEQKTGCQAKVINDADAAGLAEMHFGAGRNKSGKVMLFTLGTGIGSALFVDGKLVSNTELGHLEMRGKDAERYAAESVRIKKDLSWKKWGKRVAEYLEMIEKLFSPDVIILGGGAIKKYDKFADQLDHLSAEIIPAQNGNLAGILGAAIAGVPD